MTRPDGSQFTIFVDGDIIQERPGDEWAWPLHDPLLEAILYGT